jgi:colanic acid/amylovoran biosynthesis glycosyltransferase
MSDAAPSVDAPFERELRSTARVSAATGATKVAYIMSRFPKLSETFVLYEILAMESLGADVAVYPLLRERQQRRHPEADEWIRRARFLPFLSIPILGAQLHFLRNKPTVYLRLWLEILRGTWASANFFVGSLGILPKSVRFAWEMRARGITHVHAHFATHPAMAALIVHRLTGIPFSFTAHGSDLHVDRRMLETKVEAAAFVATVSEYNREMIVADCGAHVRDKIHVIHCGVDSQVFKPRRPRPGNRPLQMVCVASFEDVKGHRYLVEACRILRDQRLDFVCHLIGEGPLRKETERQIAKAGLGACVVLHGGQPRPVVVSMMAESDVAVLASHQTARGKREGIPVALMEAMASGVPVVATRISGIPELVEDGRTGYLVAPGDPAALAGAVRTLAGDAELRERMGRAGREKVIAEFDLRANAARLLELFIGASSHSIQRSSPDSTG